MSPVVGNKVFIVVRSLTTNNPSRQALCISRLQVSGNTAASSRVAQIDPHPESWVGVPEESFGACTTFRSKTRAMSPKICGAMSCNGFLTSESSCADPYQLIAGMTDSSNQHHPLIPIVSRVQRHAGGGPRVSSEQLVAATLKLTSYSSISFCGFRSYDEWILLKPTEGTCALQDTLHDVD
ncbi:uncharacterized protein RAG0_08689 [Rhynchosporium agropyri]|uniref:Uncharacterized protein n=1 Tax=Rhynchosporium agropyri TaxID=914238 RepID=A0A1E1KS10_9HELO|nr:uncharacterized protein RAG0_08689 [Rhynchosporium agropyri]